MAGINKLKFLQCFYNKIVFPYRLNKSFNYGTFGIYNDLLISQYKNLSELRAEQEALINRLIEFACKSSKYYSNKFDGCKSFQLEELKKLPRLAKKDLIENFDNIYNNFSLKEFEHITSGSTGQPLKVVSSNVSEAHRTAQRLRFYSWWNIKPSDANVLVWGKMETEREIKNNALKRFQDLFKGRTLNINVFDLNTVSIKGYYDKILKLKPKFIRGYTSAIYQFVCLLEQQGLDGNKLGLKVAITTSEILFQKQKDYIEKILNVKVADEYGAAEIGLFAYSCPEGSKHICEELLYIFTDEDNEIIVTDLHNYSTPLINYRTGDKIFISDAPCICGRTLRVIDRIEGRAGDQILTEGGEMLSQYLFYYAVKELDHIGLKDSIRQYRIIQRGLHFDLHIIKGRNFKEGAIIYLKNRMHEKIGKNISINIIFVDQLERDKSGKQRFFIREP